MPPTVFSFYSRQDEKLKDRLALRATVTGVQLEGEDDSMN